MLLLTDNREIVADEAKPAPRKRGRPKDTRSVVDVRSMARVHTVKCIEVLRRLVDCPKVSPAVRVAAAQVLIERGWGRPSQEIQAQLSGEVTIKWEGD